MRDQFEDRRKGLFRPDGTQIFADEEHSERLSEFRRSRNAPFDSIEAELNALAERASNEISDFENGGPAVWLSADEQEAASARLALVRADVADLGRDELIKRLSAVSQSGDRAGRVAYWMAARGKVSGTQDVEMLEALDNLREAAVPDSCRSRIDAARRSLRDAHEVEHVIYLARREASGTLGAYAPPYNIPGR
ncbi:MAG: hypothetical protein M3N18_02835 [Actinomycetota bacterium]|nr:hypothetical protein [Actinomycetota bacterium]